MDRLPEEILQLVFDNLELERAPSISKFDDEPTLDLTSSTQTPLKDLTLVCRAWRRMLIPQLFGYSRVVLPLGHVSQARTNSDSTADQEHGWMRSVKRAVTFYLDFIRTTKLARSVVSFTICAEAPFTGAQVEFTLASRQAAALWEAVFTTIDPLRVAIAAHPKSVVLFAGSEPGEDDDWLFRQDCHYLELSREPSHMTDAPSRAETQQKGAPSARPLHAIRQWTTLGYNEGSSIPAYSQYEYFHYTAPQALRGLLDRIQAPAARLASVKYVSCFPPVDHVRVVFMALAGMETLESLEVRFAPAEGSDALSDARMGRSDRRDCWREWTQAVQCVGRLMMRAGRGDESSCAPLLRMVRAADYWSEGLKGDLEAMLQLAGWKQVAGCSYMVEELD